MVALLDVNVLLALALPNNVFHGAAHRWFAENHEQGWATCLLTQSSFVRLYCNPSVTKMLRSSREAMSVLRAAVAHPNHVYWQLDTEMTDIIPEISARMMGHKQVMDAVLLDLAIRRGSRFATFDKRLLSLLPAGSALREHVALIPFLD